MNTVFYISSAVAIAATCMVITQRRAVHALLYLILSLLSIALVFFTLGAPFVAALEVIIYAGAIMVLFVFVIMMLNLGRQAAEQERHWLGPRTWIGPGILAAILFAEVVYVLARGSANAGGAIEIGPHAVGLSLFGPYLLGVELAALILLAGLVGAYHLGRRSNIPDEKGS
jgi:NADH-quinone oxidoreductase subunit J